MDTRGRSNEDIRVAVIGLGYVGLTVATVLAEEGFEVIGVDRDAGQLDAISRCMPRFFEPGLENGLRQHLGRNFTVAPALEGKAPDVVIVAVSTPVENGRADLSCLKDAAAELAPVVGPETLVIVRSTVPVGTTREIVAPLLGDTLLAFCPERTIQGQALDEIRSLPQLVGALDAPSTQAALDFFRRVARRCIRLSTPEAAEMAKLVNNTHTDVLYAFANEVAGIAEGHGLDPLEVVHACNSDYPRPDVARPGFVGGACISKDPYLLLEGAESFGPSIVRASRRTNELLPVHLGARVAADLRAVGKDPVSARIVVCGLAYKGVPVTDDLRGSPAGPFLEGLGRRITPVHGHDFLVDDARVRELGYEPLDIETELDGIDALVLLNNHRGYRRLGERLHEMAVAADGPLLIVDCWRILDPSAPGGSAVAIETGAVGPSKHAAGGPRPFTDPRDVPGILYSAIALRAPQTCESSSPAVVVS